MTTETILTPEQVDALLEGVLRASGSRIGNYTYQKTLDELRSSIRAIEQAVLQSPEIQTLRDLLKEARQQLPLAAQFWNEDEEPERRSRNVKRVMELIARIDAAMEQQA